MQPALFVENQGQWADASTRYGFEGSGAHALFTDAGPVLQASQREPVDGAGSEPGIHWGDG